MFPLRVIDETKMSEINLSLYMYRPWVDLSGKPFLNFLRTNDERGHEWQLLKIECTLILLSLLLLFIFFQFCEFSINGNTRHTSYINKQKRKRKRSLQIANPLVPRRRGRGREGKDTLARPMHDMWLSARLS